MIFFRENQGMDAPVWKVAFINPRKKRKISGARMSRLTKPFISNKLYGMLDFLVSEGFKNG